MFGKQRQEYETQLVQTVVTNQNRKLFRGKQKLLDYLNEAIKELDEHMKCFQERIDSTQNKAHPAENTIELTEEQIYYLLISEMAEKHDMVHEIHWVNEPPQLHYVHQQNRLSEWERFEVPFCQTEQLRNIVEETETYCSSKTHHRVDENVKATN